MARTGRRERYVEFASKPLKKKKKRLKNQAIDGKYALKLAFK